ncbi:MAG: amidohydrolase [Anaerolineaceae bacterium]|nr:amidohydrolase [Anaerolineaceae bacterium]
MDSNQPLEVDILFKGGTVVTMDANLNVIPNAALAVKGEKIAWISSAEGSPGCVNASKVIDTRGKVIVPGFINTHSHIAMSLFRGLVDDHPLAEWLDKVLVYEKKYTSPENVVTGAQLAMIEMIRSGTTCVADMYWQFEYTTEAARKANFRMVNGPSFTFITGYGGVQPADEITALDYLERYAQDTLIQCCVQVHSTYTSHPEMLARARELSERFGVVFITHASESRAEVDQVLKEKGKTPIGVLEQHGLLGPRTLLAHCVYLDDAEIELLAARSVSVAHCPQSNMKLGSGIARVPDMLAAGVNVALGTDGPASNNDLDMLDEMRSAALLHKGARCDPTVLPARQALAMMTINAARALGMGDRLGSLEAGKLADVTVLDFDAPHLMPCYDVFSHLVYAANRSDVCTVLINGRLVMEDRQLLTLDEDAVKENVRAIHLGDA